MSLNKRVKGDFIIESIDSGNTITLETAGVTVNSNFYVKDANELRLYEDEINGINYTGFKAPALLAADTIYTLPSDTPANGEVLTWNTGGTLSWEVAGGGGATNNWLEANNGVNFITAPDAAGSNSIALGDAAAVNALTANSIAIGNGSTIDSGSADSVVVGQNSDISDTAIGSVIVGPLATVGTGAARSVVIGSSADSLSSYGIAIGEQAGVIASSTNGIAIGRTSSVQNLDGIAIGRSAIAEGTYGITIGKGARDNAAGTGIAIGADSDAAVGLVTSYSTIAIGTYSGAAGYYGVAIGYGSRATAGNSIAIGRSSSATSEDSIAIGRTATAPANGMQLRVNDGTLAATLDMTNAGVVSCTGSSAQINLPVYTTAQANALLIQTTGSVIYVSDGDGGSPCLAVRDGTTWKRIALGATINAAV